MKDLLVKFFYDNYPNVKEQYTIASIYDMFERINNQYCYRIRNGKVEFLAIYLKINDKYHDFIFDNPQKLCDPCFIMKCLCNLGRHIHFVSAVGQGSGNILWCLKEVIKKENPESVSWFKSDMNKIHLIKRRKKLCLSQH